MPKIIGGSLHEHREQTRLKLFGALSELMAERGFDAITLADIAATAGVGRTAVYNHFADKEAMLFGFILHETGQYVRALEAQLADIEDPTEQLRTYIRAQSELKREYHMIPGPEMRSVLSRSTQQRVREHVVMVEQVLRRILAAGMDSGAFPAQDLSTVVGLVNACLTRTLPEDTAARTQAIDSTVTFVLRAVGAAPADPARTSDPEGALGAGATTPEDPDGSDSARTAVA